MSPNPEDAIVILSDFHLGAGSAAGGGSHESFFHDAAFARFLDDQRRRAAADRQRLRLVLLGDVVDFLRVRPVAPGSRAHEPRASLASASETLDRIAAAHPAYFAALARFVADDFPIAILPGNHDVELAFRPVQDRFTSLIAAAGAPPGATAGVTYHPWIYHLPGVLYAEHGHQYHDLNAFPTLLRPNRPGHPDRVEPPLGSLLETYLLDLDEAISPEGSTGAPHLGQVLRALRARPGAAVRTLPSHARFAAATVAHLVRRTAGARASERAAYQEAVVRPHAVAVGLDADTLVAIDGLAAVSPWAMLGRLARTAARRPRQATPPTSYLVRAAGEIAERLRAGGAAVPFYVFGHTHAAALVPLGPGPAGPTYVNPGSWTAEVPPDRESPTGHAPFTFVRIDREPESANPVARLMRWDDGVGRPEVLAQAGAPEGDPERRT